jgi:hypothetical protein
MQLFVFHETLPHFLQKKKRKEGRKRKGKERKGKKEKDT